VKKNQLERLVADYGHHDFFSFWQKVKSSDKCSVAVSQQIDNAVGMHACCNEWANVYEALFSLSNDLDDFDNVRLNDRLDVLDSHFTHLTDEDVLSAISKLGRNKSTGPDYLCAEHYKYCDIFYTCPLSAFQ